MYGRLQSVLGRPGCVAILCWRVGKTVSVTRLICLERAAPTLAFINASEPLTTFLLKPPYAKLEPLGAEHAPGDLVLLADPGPEEVHDRAIALRRAHPHCSLVLYLSAPLETVLPIIRIGALAGARAVVRPEEDLRDVLRRRLIEYGSLSAVVMEWINTHRGYLHPRIATQLVQILDGDVAAQKRSRSSRQLKQGELPSVRAWTAFGRVVAAARMMQRDASLTLAAVAAAAGYCDQPAMNRAIARTLRCSPRDLRARLGIDWMLGAFLTSARSVSLSRPATSGAKAIKTIERTGAHFQNPGAVAAAGTPRNGHENSFRFPTAR